jgi:hypothetical protein
MKFGFVGVIDLDAMAVCQNLTGGMKQKGEISQRQQNEGREKMQARRLFSLVNLVNIWST